MSVKISEAFPSQYLKCADLNGTPHTVIIRTCALEELGQGNDKEKKPVLYFEKAQKGLVLNKTNANVIAAAYGDDTSNWAGEPIEVYPTLVDFKGKQVDGIRVRVVQEAQPEPQPTAAPMADAELDDEIPF